MPVRIFHNPTLEEVIARWRWGQQQHKATVLSMDEDIIDGDTLVEHYRWSNDDGTHATATFAADEDTADDIDLSSGDAQRHLRFCLQVPSDLGVPRVSARIYYDINSGGPTLVTSSTTEIHSDTGSELTDDTSTAQRLSDPNSVGGGNFDNFGFTRESSGTSITSEEDLTDESWAEWVFALNFVAAQFSDNDSIVFTVEVGRNEEQIFFTCTHTVAPTITIDKGAATRATGRLSLLGVGHGAGA